MSVTIHQGSSFVVSTDAGDIVPEGARGFFHLDTRFLSRHELRLDGEPPVLLQASTPHAHECWHFLTNPELRGARRSTLGVAVQRTLGGGLSERIEIENFDGAEAAFELQLRFASDFAYILTVKKEVAGGDAGWHPQVRAEVPRGDEVRLELVDADRPHRTRLAFHPAPGSLDGREARFPIRLAPRGRWTLLVEVSPTIGDQDLPPRPPGPEALATTHRRRQAIRQGMVRTATDHPVLGRAVERAVRDLGELRIKAESVAVEGEGTVMAIAAGIPWYMDLFGRDSLIASYQAMVVDPDLARGTLESLAALQGTKRDPVSEEAPGKILHEYRRGPLTPAARTLIPAYPYYGTIDATPLFLVTLSEYVRVTGDLELARRLWPHAERAVDWMRHHGDRDGDGLLEYQLDADVGLVNQGWKDSTDSIRFRDGAIARPPIALVEVQGYACDARRRTAELARALGHGEEAERLEEEAAALQRRIDERFWMPARGFFAEALDGAKAQVDALTSNPGHLLWSGAVDPARARDVARVLLSAEMFSGFGVRTMGEREGGYNPVSYHDGSVWPHDNAIILSGLVRYGLREEASRLAAGLLEALSRFPRLQPSELFCGYPAERFGTPVRYPTACRPQAWASGSVLLLLRALLGLEIDAHARRVAVAPTPLPGLTRLEVAGLRAGSGRLTVRVRVEGERAHADVQGLPAGWSRVEPEELAAG